MNDDRFYPIKKSFVIYVVESMFLLWFLVAQFFLHWCLCIFLRYLAYNCILVLFLNNLRNSHFYAYKFSKILIESELCFSCIILVHIPESEDGASLLGSSRKSLADTSVTSTADLSILSGGQRSQQTFGYDDNPDCELGDNDNEGESSPG
jgi:hypothetical protein